MNKKQLQENFKTNDRKSKVNSATSKGKRPIEYSMESGKLVEKEKYIPISIEVKRRKSALKTVYDWVKQCTNHDKGDPVVFYRSDRHQWLVISELPHYLKLIRSLTKDGKH